MGKIIGIDLGTTYSLVAAVLSTGGPRRLYARAKKTIDRVLGAALILLGVRMGVDH